MFLLIFIFNILSAQEVTLEFNDWNYDTKIEIDSLNIRNIGLGIDTTLINPKSIDIHNLLIINDVEEERLNKYSLNYSSNILKINSKEIINNLKVIDLLGKTIFEDSPNNTSFEKSINLQENLTFVILTINNKTYSQKLYNINEEFYKSPSLIMNDESTWYFTPYKEKYRDTTYTFQNYQLKDTLDIDLKRKRYSISLNINLNEVLVQNHNIDYDPSSGKNYGKDTTYKTPLTLNRSIILYEKKHSDFIFVFECSNNANLLVSGDGYIESNISGNNTNAFQLLFKGDSISVINTGYKYYNSNGGFDFSCTSEVLKMRLTHPISLENSLRELTNSEMYFNYEFYSDNKSGSYYSNSTSKNNLGVVDISLSIQKLD